MSDTNGTGAEANNDIRSEAMRNPTHKSLIYIGKGEIDKVKRRKGEAKGGKKKETS